MFYIFNVDGNCVGQASGPADQEDLESRGETQVEIEKVYHDLGRLRLRGTEVEVLPEDITPACARRRTKEMAYAAERSLYWTMFDEPEKSAEWKAHYRKLAGLDQLEEWPNVQWPDAPAE